MCSLSGPVPYQCNLFRHMEVYLDSFDPQERSACCFLQHLPPEAPQMFVTLNPPKPPAADKTIRHLQLAHPVYR